MGSVWFIEVIFLGMNTSIALSEQLEPEKVRGRCVYLTCFSATSQFTNSSAFILASIASNNFTS